MSKVRAAVLTLHLTQSHTSRPFFYSLYISAEDTISRPLDLCTTKKQSVVLTNNNSYEDTQLLQASTASSSKAIWSPASSCEEENRNQQLCCTACHRSFSSPTKLELHLRKVHAPHHSVVVGGSSRKERVFKVFQLSSVPAADAAAHRAPPLLCRLSSQMLQQLRSSRGRPPHCFC